MKKAMLIFGIVAFTGVLSLTSCGSSEDSKTEKADGKEYYCPMKCEAEKMYAKEGKCPVCKMELIKD